MAYFLYSIETCCLLVKKIVMNTLLFTVLTDKTSRQKNTTIDKVSTDIFEPWSGQ
jgi:hypothetical protein